MIIQYHTDDYRYSTGTYGKNRSSNLYNKRTINDNNNDKNDNNDDNNNNNNNNILQFLILGN